MAKFPFKKQSRLLLAAEFTRVFQSADFKISSAQLLILASNNRLNRPRLGLVIAKKNVRLAVQRNRIKRRIRETFRLKQHKMPNIDAIVLARRGIDKLSDQQQTALLDQQWQRLIKRVNKSSVTPSCES
ncbi:ribonuclease P protein component [Aurantivibrio infirmus]